MENVTPLVRLDQRQGIDGRDYWVVLLPSPVPGIGWIVQGEHLTKQAAEADAKAFQ